MSDPKWICLTDRDHADQRVPVVVRYDLIDTVEIDDLDSKTARIHTSSKTTEVKESLVDVFLAPVSDTPLMAIQKWQENA